MNHISFLKSIVPIVIVTALISFIIAAIAMAGNPEELYLQIKDPRMRLYVRSMLAPPDGSDMFYHSKGNIFAYIPGDIYRPPSPGAEGSYYAHGGGGRPILGFEVYTSIPRAACIQTLMFQINLSFLHAN